ncbi:unnamed protein product [Sphagnum troendelagicum]
MFSFKFHSFIHLGAFVGGVVACLDALLVSASHRSLGVVCVCVCVYARKLRGIAFWRAKTSRVLLQCKATNFVTIQIQVSSKSLAP